MTATQQTSISTRQAKRLLLLTTLSLTTTLSFTAGCQSMGQRIAKASKPASRPESFEQDALAADVHQESSVPPASHLVKTVGFTERFDDEASSESFRDAIALESPSETVHVAPLILDEIGTPAIHSDGLTLEAIESMAMANNPSIAELIATTQKAAGFRTQVSLRANPTIGYNGTQIADLGTDQHTVFISQTIITGDKLALNRSVLNEALRSQLLELEAQKYRVATDIRVKFYEALAAQSRVNVIREFQAVVDEGLRLTETRKEALEGSQLEVVQAKVQRNEIDLALRQAEVRFQAAWREMAALAGSPDLLPVPLEGKLPKTEVSQDWSIVAANMIASSPEYQAARIRVSQARANICRQEAQPIPNLDVNFAAGVDNSTNNGLINLQIGAPIPVFNKNQGNITAARAEYVRASREVDRIENSIKARLAAVSSDFDSSLAAVDQYSNAILPNADEGLRLAEIAYKAGETSFVQVLVARRTYFDTNLQYIASQALLAQARARLDGYVLTGALNSVVDNSGDDSLRGLTFSQQ